MDIRVKMALDKIKGLLKPEDVQKACNEAVNRTMITFVNRASRAVWETLNMKLRDVKSQFKQRKSSVKNGAAAETYLSRQGIPLMGYMTTAQILAGYKHKGSKGISVRARTSGEIEKHPHWFVATMSSGHTNVFERTGTFGRRGNPKHEKIKQKFGPTVIGVLANAEDTEGGGGTILDAAEGESAEVLANNLASQLDRFLAKYRGK